MALFLSDRLTSASGSVGGTTYSHNRNGLYVKARRVPVNPNTPAQQAQRAAFSSGSSGWRALTGAQRDAWRAYAAATPVKNALGMTTFLTGAQQYTASASFSTRLLQPPVAAGPTTPGRVDIGSPTVAIHSATGGSVVVAAVATDDATLAVFFGDPQSAGVVFFNGPYQLVTSSDVTAGTFTVTPLLGRNGLPIATGQRIPWRLAGIDLITGRLSTIASGLSVAT